MNESVNIFGLQINLIGYDRAMEQVKHLGWEHEPSYVCFANVHMVMEARKDPMFAKQVNGATLVLADGVPLTRASSLLYGKRQPRIAGMDFMPSLLASMNEDARPFRVFFYGSTIEVLESLAKHVQHTYKNVKIAGVLSPPFRPLTAEEINNDIDTINQSGAHVVFVGLGCPKQEKWMAAHHQKIHAVLLGVGGVFPVAAGFQKRAPSFMQKAGLEWFYRFLQEPRRLFKRYLITNSLFIGLLVKALAKKMIYGRR